MVGSLDSLLIWGTLAFFLEIKTKVIRLTQQMLLPSDSSCCLI